MSSSASTFSFKDERFLSGGEKLRILSAWIRFLKQGCQYAHFTDALYTHLTLRCSFIAHFDRAGFYQHYFAAGSSRALDFLDQFDPCKPGISVEYGDCHWLSSPTGADLNAAMRETASTFLPRLRLQFSDAARRIELQLAQRLAARHGMRITTLEPGPSMPDADLSPDRRATVADQQLRFGYES